MKTALEMVLDDCSALRELGLPGVPPNEFTKSREHEIIEMYNSGSKVSDITDLICSLYTIHRKILAD